MKLDNENKIHKQFLDSGCFKNINNPDFISLLPPPNVTGSLHLGHALEVFIIDTFLRFESISGNSSYLQTGLDHSGIVTQVLTLRELENNNCDVTTLSNKDIFNYCMNFAHRSMDNIVSQFKSLNVSSQWDNIPFTLDEDSSNAVKFAFEQMYNTGLIYRDKMMVNWDTVAQTAISDLECKSKTVNGKMYYIKYLIHENQDYITIATTRPETIFGDAAIAVHPDDERWKSYVGKTAIVPICGRKIPIIADHRVSIDKGTGALKITPSHDWLDYEIGLDHNLKAIEIIDNSGSLSHKDIPLELRGIKVNYARTMMERILNDSIDHIEEIQHDVSFSERTNAIVEPMVKDQWFLYSKDLINEIKEKIQNDEIEIYPSKMKAHLIRWLDNMKPWCISRQIAWGHRMPVWELPSGKYIIASNNDILQSKVEDAGYSINDAVQIPDVLDTWFSSSLWPLLSLRWPIKSAKYPIDMLVTGYDILFFWVARMMLSCYFIKKSLPFKKIVIHGIIRDKNGDKMSKSRGNVIDPISIINEYGVDQFRLTCLTSSTTSADIKFSISSVKDKMKFINKFINFGKFANLNGVKLTKEFNKQVKIDVSKIADHDAWILDKFNDAYKAMNNELRKHNIFEAFKILNNFFRNNLCDKYVESYKAYKIINDNNESLAVLSYLTYMIALALYPYIPHTTQQFIEICHLYEPICNEKSWKYPLIDVSSRKQDIQNFESIYKAINSIRFARNASEIGMSRILNIKVFFTEDSIQKTFENSKSIFEKLARVSSVNHDVEFANTLNFASFGYIFEIDMPVDHNTILEVIAKRISKVHKDYERLDNQVKNENFMKFAKQEVLDKTISDHRKCEKELKLLNSLKFNI